MDEIINTLKMELVNCCPVDVQSLKKHLIGWQDAVTSLELWLI